MESNVIFNNKENKPITPDAVLKVVSLIYLEDVVQKEKYEDALTFIKKAQKYGAQPDEIVEAINAALYGVKATRQVEVEEVS